MQEVLEKNFTGMNQATHWTEEGSIYDDEYLTVIIPVVPKHVAFHDIVDITVQGGRGGDGCMSMLRLKYLPKGGPDGGNGGEGGSVYLVAVSDVTSLDRLLDRRVFKAKDGKHGEGRNKAGHQGKELTIQVPIGTAAYDKETGEFIADLIEVGQIECVAKGGSGGRGNASFATARRRAPRFAEYGTLGEKRNLRLELRLIADIGLVGYPNAGKSSLVAALSNAKPQIAAYPFTTISPNLGVVQHGVDGRFTLADIPGIVQGASQGKGLGLEFLRHISRTRLLAYVLDISLKPKESLQTLQKELQSYDYRLLERPAVILLNKIDLVNTDKSNSTINDMAHFGLPVLTTSALSGEGLTQVKDTLFTSLPIKQITPLTTPTKIVRVKPVKVKRVAAGWLVTGNEIEKLVERFDVENSEAVAYLQRHFKELGVSTLLKSMGAQGGEDVFVGEAVFEYFDEEKIKAASPLEDSC